VCVVACEYIHAVGHGILCVVLLYSDSIFGGALEIRPVWPVAFPRGNPLYLNKTSILFHVGFGRNVLDRGNCSMRAKQPYTLSIRHERVQ
jgi:hypothetical protein